MFFSGKSMQEDCGNFISDKKIIFFIITFTKIKITLKKIFLLAGPTSEGRFLETHVHYRF